MYIRNVITSQKALRFHKGNKIFRFIFFLHFRVVGPDIR